MDIAKGLEITAFSHEKLYPMDDKTLQSKSDNNAEPADYDKTVYKSFNTRSLIIQWLRTLVTCVLILQHNRVLLTYINNPCMMASNTFVISVSIKQHSKLISRDTINPNTKALNIPAKIVITRQIPPEHPN